MGANIKEWKSELGITYYAHDNTYIEQKQFWGTVVSANNDGIKIRQSNGEFFNLPPDLSSTEPAPQGEYKLKSTGEIIINPDYFATWSLYKPEDSKN